MTAPSAITASIFSLPASHFTASGSSKAPGVCVTTMLASGTP